MCGHRFANLMVSQVAVWALKVLCCSPLPPRASLQRRPSRFLQPRLQHIRPTASITVLNGFLVKMFLQISTVVRVKECVESSAIILRCAYCVMKISSANFTELLCLTLDSIYQEELTRGSDIVQYFCAKIELSTDAQVSVLQMPNQSRLVQVTGMF